MTPQTDVYLNVDGVLLNGSQPANHSREFIRYVVHNFDTYWLSSRAKDQNFTLLKDLAKHFEPEIINLLGRVRPTRWSWAKTDAINFSRPFLWFDDELVIHERMELIKNGAPDSWIKVDLNRDENRLTDFLLRFPQPASYIL